MKKTLNILATAAMICCSAAANADTVTVTTGGTLTAGCALDRYSVAIVSVITPATFKSASNDAAFTGGDGSRIVGTASGSINVMCSAGSAVTIGDTSATKGVHTINYAGSTPSVNYSIPVHFYYRYHYANSDNSITGSGYFKDGPLSFTSDGSQMTLTIEAVLTSTDAKMLPGGNVASDSFDMEISAN